MAGFGVVTPKVLDSVVVKRVRDGAIGGVEPVQQPFWVAEPDSDDEDEGDVDYVVHWRTPDGVVEREALLGVEVLPLVRIVRLKWRSESSLNKLLAELEGLEQRRKREKQGPARPSQRQQLQSMEPSGSSAGGGAAPDAAAAAAAAEAADASRLGPARPSQRQQLQSMEPSGSSAGGGAAPVAAAAAAAAAAEAADASRILLPELLQRIAGFMEVNEVVFHLRLVSPSAGKALRAPQWTTARPKFACPPEPFRLQWSRPDAIAGLTRKQKKKLEVMVAATGSIANMRVLLARGDLPRLSLPPPSWGRLVEAAARWGHVALGGWLQAQGAPVTEGVLFAAVESGSTEAVAAVLAAAPSNASGASPFDQSCKYAEWAMVAASRSDVRMMEWLLARITVSSVRRVFQGLRFMQAVCYGCPLDVLQRIHARYYAPMLEAGHVHLSDANGVVDAAGSPTADWLGKLDWLLQQGFPVTSGVFQGAAMQPDGFQRVQLLLQRGYPLAEGVLYAAAVTGNLDILHLVHGGDPDMVRTCSACIGAAGTAGHLPYVRAVCEAGWAEADCIDTALANAAASGHADILSWASGALGQARVLSLSVINAAARSCNWAVLRWLVDTCEPSNVPVSVVCKVAADGSCEQLEWLVSKGCTMGAWGEPYMYAASRLNLASMQTLRRLGCPFMENGATVCGVMAEAVKYAVRKSSPAAAQQAGGGGGGGSSSIGAWLVRALEWLVREEGCPVNWLVARMRAEELRIGGAVARWLQEQSEAA